MNTLHAKNMQKKQYTPCHNSCKTSTSKIHTILEILGVDLIL